VATLKELKEQRDIVFGHYQELWALACKHDGIDVATNYVVFSEKNPYAPALSDRMVEWVTLNNAVKLAEQDEQKKGGIITRGTTAS
jgi:hypothetical protein